MDDSKAFLELSALLTGLYDINKDEDGPLYLPVAAEYARHIRGEFTDTFSADSAARFQELDPRALIVTVKGAGHLVHLDKPETVETIAKFLS